MASSKEDLPRLRVNEVLRRLDAHDAELIAMGLNDPVLLTVSKALAMAGFQSNSEFRVICYKAEDFHRVVRLLAEQRIAEFKARWDEDTETLTFDNGSVVTVDFEPEETETRTQTPWSPQSKN